MSAREEVQALLERAQADGRSSEYVAGLQDALVAVTEWQRSTNRWGTPRLNTPERKARARNRVQRRRKRLNDELIENSMSRRKHYSYAEWVVIMDRELSAQEVARRLGRTYRGIMHARSKLARGYVPDPGTVRS
jgi:hypothetical protein